MVEGSLGPASLIAFVGTTHPARARQFYGAVLGLRCTAEDRFGLVFDAGGTMLRVTRVASLCPAAFTILGWSVPSIREAVARLVSRGVAFQRYEGLSQDASGVCTFPDGTQVAWFLDPDGNNLSLTQFPTPGQNRARATGS